MPKLVVALLVAALAAAIPAACGGEDSSTDEPSSTSTTTPRAESGSTKANESQPDEKEGAGESRPQKAKGPSDEPSSSGNSRSSAAARAVPPLQVSAGGSAQYRTEGGDNSIQDFGEEGDEAELQQAAEALHAFYVARAAEDWEAACSHLAAQLVKQFEQLAARSPQLKGASCPTVLKAFTRPLPPSVVRETTQIDAASLRHEGERAFLIYKGGEGTVYAIPMQHEDGSWKVAGLAGTPLS